MRHGWARCRSIGRCEGLRRCCENVYRKGSQKSLCSQLPKSRVLSGRNSTRIAPVLALKDLDLLKLVRVGDFVISLRSFQGGIEYAREQGIISPA